MYKVDPNLMCLFEEYQEAGGQGPATSTNPMLSFDGDRVRVDVGTADFVAGWYNVCITRG